MLVNVKSFKKIFFISILLSVNLNANEKNQIIDKLNNLNSLEFTFIQQINEKTEKGSCILKFPGKLKISYNKEARIIDMMKEKGIVSKANHVGKREDN